jgi:hypothetical protein
MKLKHIFISIYLTIYKTYICAWNWFLTKFGDQMLIYYIHDGGKKNITINYISGWGLHGFKSGTYYIKHYTLNGENHVAFHGEIDHIEHIKQSSNDQAIKRKQCVLLADNETIDFDLHLLDNYRKNMQYYDRCITNLAEILNILGQASTHVAIIEKHSPLVRKKFSTHEINIDHLYY